MACALPAIILACLFIATIMELPTESRGLTPIVNAHMHLSGVEHGVTAVLLNFRAYDTWLEIGVLLLAILGVLSLERHSDMADKQSMPLAEPILNWLIRLLIPMMVLTGGYLLWMGKYSSGGAFQAGVILGAAGVLLWLAGYRSVAGLPPRILRILLSAGFGVFVILAMATVISGDYMIRYKVDWAGHIILALEFAATISIAVTVAALVIALQPSVPGHKKRRKNS